MLTFFKAEELKADKSCSKVFDCCRKELLLFTSQAVNINFTELQFDFARLYTKTKCTLYTLSLNN